MEHAPSRPHNRLLAALPATDAQALGASLKTVPLRAHAVLDEPGDEPGEVYFPHGGVVSIGVALANADVIQAAVVGHDGVLGGMAALERCAGCTRTTVYIETTASTLSVARLREIAARYAAIRSMLLRYHHFLFAQAQWTAACNASHALEQRLARSLLRFAQVSGMTTLALTQELLAELLGVKRTSVSLIAHRMQQDGLIRIRRGHIDLLKPDALEQAACECHRNMTHHYRLLFGASGSPAQEQQAMG